LTSWELLDILMLDFIDLKDLKWCYPLI